MYPGQIITYTIYPVAGIPVHWVTEITQVQKPFYFIDEQRFGPYACWHHEHRFVSIEGGVEMKDIIYYKMPFGPLGKLIHALKVKKDLENIFAYRKIKLESLFGHFQQPS
jgi:ligand-binding SRPBCC domain-containing protein